MKPTLTPIAVLSLLALLGGCAGDAGSPHAVTETDGDPHVFAAEHDFLTDFDAVNSDGSVNVVIEIPAGTTAKWEVTKPDGRLEWELRDGAPRVVRYLGYPGNYGMVPRTLLAKTAGGDGDPLDVIVLGAAVPRGTVARTRIIGMLKLLDGGERDDKLLATLEGTPFHGIDDLDELQTAFPGVTTILETFFTSYKGPDAMESRGYEGTEAALRVLDAAREAFESRHPPRRGAAP